MAQFRGKRWEKRGRWFKYDLPDPGRLLYPQASTQLDLFQNELPDSELLLWPQPLYQFHPFIKCPKEIRFMFYDFMRPRIIQVERRDNLLVHTRHAHLRREAIPNTLHVCRESRGETLRRYAPPADCPYKDYVPPPRPMGLSTCFYDSEVDTVSLSKVESIDLGNWACAEASTRYGGVYTTGMVLNNIGEDLSNIQKLSAAYTITEEDELVRMRPGETEKPLILFMGLFPGLKHYTHVLTSFDFEFGLRGDALVNVLKKWFPAFKALNLKIIKAPANTVVDAEDEGEAEPQEAENYRKAVGIPEIVIDSNPGAVILPALSSGPGNWGATSDFDSTDTEEESDLDMTDIEQESESEYRYKGIGGLMGYTSI
jgi:hypothetical protein